MPRLPLLLALALAATAGCKSKPRPVVAAVDLACATPDAATAQADAKVLQARLKAGDVDATVHTTPEHGLRVDLHEGAFEPPLSAWLYRGVLELSPVAVDQSPLAPSRHDVAALGLGTKTLPGGAEVIAGPSAAALKPALASLSASLPADRVVRVECGEEREEPACHPLLLEPFTTLRPKVTATDVVETEWGPPAVAVSLDEASAAAFERLTGQLVQRQLAIVLDEVVLSSPVVMERIPGGKVHINLGVGAREDEARRMAALLASGPLGCAWTVRAQR